MRQRTTHSANMTVEGRQVIGPMEFCVQYVIPGTPLGARAVAVSLRALFENVPLLDAEASLLELALTEVMNNIVLHSYGDHGEGDMKVKVEFRENTLTVTILDKGRGPSSEDVGGSYTLPQPKTEKSSSNIDLPQGGRGLYIISKIVDSIEFDKIGDENKVWLTKEIGRA